MNIHDFSAKNNEEMAERVFILKEEKQWSANDYTTPKEIAKELVRLNNELNRSDMPDSYYESIRKHIEDLKVKQEHPYDDKPVDNKMIVNDQEFINAMDKIDASSNSVKEAYDLKCKYINSVETEILSEDVLYYALNESSLPENPEFGVPEEKKYPLYDKRHVISAIKLFGHVNPKYEAGLAHMIIARMKKYNIPFDMVGEDNKLYKYLPETALKEEEVMDSKTSVLNSIRSDYQGELKAIKDYDTHADNCEKNGYIDIANVLRDIRDEEKVHLGELQKVLSKYDSEYEKSVKSGHKEAAEKLTESVIDPVHDKLCQDLFDGEERRSDVIDYILKAIMDWKQTVHFDKDFLAITCSGSLLTYQYNPTTDLDVHIYVDSLSQEERDNISKVVPKAIFIPNTNHPVEYTIMEFTPDHDKNAENLYDVLKRQWLRRKTKDEMGQQVPTDYITRISKFFMMAIDAALGQIEVHKAQLKNLQNMEIEESFSEEDKIKAIKEKCNDLIEDRDSVWFMVKLLRAFRSTAYDNYKERAIDAGMLLGVNFELSLPADPHYSLNEMIFKTIERFGYKTRLDNAKNELDTIIKSIEDQKTPVVNGKESISRDETIPEGAKHQTLTESVTFVDNAGNLKTMSAANYNKDMHEYHTKYEIKKFKLKKDLHYKLRSDD